MPLPIEIAKRAREKFAELERWVNTSSSSRSTRIEYALLREILCDHTIFQYDAKHNKWIPSPPLKDHWGGCYCKGCGLNANTYLGANHAV